MNVHPADLDRIRRIVAEARAVDATDDTLVEDMLEAETDFDTIVGNLLAEMREDLAGSAAMSHVGDQYHERARVLKDRASRKRTLLGRLRDVVGQNIKHPAGTVIVSVRKAQPEVDDDVDVNLLADEFVRVKREPDKNAMKAAFEAGRNVPGVRWGEAKRQVTIK